MAIASKKYFLKNINNILNFVLTNQFSDFYRKKYKDQNFKINSYENFQEIPFLEKKEIMKTALSKFTFVHQKKITRYMFSSGTTGKPLITAHDAPSPIIPGRVELFEKIGLKKALFLFPINIQNDRIPALTPQVLGISGDIYNLPLMSHLTKEGSINGISSTPTILEFFIKELGKISNFDFKQIKWVELAGEFCTKQRTEYFKEVFPSAYFDHIWGATETGGHKGYRCKHLYNETANIFHTFNNYHFLEILGEEEGEIVHTDLYPKATTLIRYKTGDMGEIKKIDCACGNNYVIELLGRANYDRLKIQGVILQTEAIENSLDKIREYFKQGFKMHVYESKEERRIMPKLKLQLILNNKNKLNEPYFKEKITKKISENLYLSPQSTLENLVRKNIFLPLEI